MILMPQIFDVTATENARYKRNELECVIIELLFLFHIIEDEYLPCQILPTQ